MMFKKWVASDDNGRDIFYFAVFDFLSERVFSSNLPRLYSYNALQSQIAILTDTEAGEAQLNYAARELIKKIKMIDDFWPFFFPDCMLDKNGKLDDSKYDFLKEQEERYENIKMQSWYPYSENSRPKTFNHIMTHISYTVRPGICGYGLKKIHKTFFESKLLNGKLVDCYLDNFNKKASYYCFSDEWSKLFIMEINGKIRMLFFTWLWREEAEEHKKCF